MSSIKGFERKLLRKALGEAFQSYEALRRMALDQLDSDLNSRTDARAGVEAAADALIEAMDELGGRAGVVRLIQAARAERPDHPALREAERLIMQTSDPLGDVYPTRAVADKVVNKVSRQEFDRLVGTADPSADAYPTRPVADDVIDRAGLERVIVDAAGLPEFSGVASRLASAEYRICLVSYRLPDGRPVYGTGFLVADDLIMTNYHVIEGAIGAALAGSAVELAFGYRSKESHVSRCELVAGEWLVASDKALDYAILRAQGAPGAQMLVEKGTVARGFFRLISETPQPHEPLFLLQHPYDKLDGSPATLRLTVGFVLEKSEGQPEYVLRHSANTSEGSSGSPVFTGRMDLVAVHHWGGPKHNQAILASAIKNHLAVAGRADLLG